MKTCEYAGVPFTEPRSHPWLGAEASPESRYYDLTASPGHIRRSLEDFRVWSHYPAIEAFYGLLERLNHPKSALESNDCSFTGPEQNENAAIDQPLECSGRLMILFRSLERNTVGANVRRLEYELHHDLADIDPLFRWGVIGTTVVPVRYLALPESDDGQLGSQLMISFWAWSDTEANTMRNVGRLFGNLSHALRAASARH
jgi:hypothetical protein